MFFGIPLNPRFQQFIETEASDARHANQQLDRRLRIFPPQIDEKTPRNPKQCRRFSVIDALI